MRFVVRLVLFTSLLATACTGGDGSTAAVVVDGSTDTTADPGTGLDTAITRTRPPIVETIPPTTRPPTTRPATVEPEGDVVQGDPWAFNEVLARTINLGGTLELDRDEEPWGPDLDPSDIDDIAARGFTAVRIPINFPSWAGSAGDGYLIDQEIFDRVDVVLEAAAANDLAAIIDVHQFEAINLDPEGNRELLLAVWRQVATRYRDLPLDQVAFEILNEPNTNLTSDKWNPLMAEAIAEVRAIDPLRTLIVGPTNWYDNLSLPSLELPDDGNLIVSFHYYTPFEFTHQGAPWLEGMDEFLGTSWDSSASIPDEASGLTEGALIDREFAEVAEWARERNVPIFLGEFGVLDGADADSRVKWVRWVREAADNEGFTWGYWDWAAPGFGLENDETGEWNEGLMQALMPTGD